MKRSLITYRHTWEETSREEEHRRGRVQDMDRGGTLVIWKFDDLDKYAMYI